MIENAYVRGKRNRMGFYAKVDLGIVKYHFQIGTGETGWAWSE